MKWHHALSVVGGSLPDGHCWVLAKHVQFLTSDKVISALIDIRCSLDNGWRAVNNMFSSLLCFPLWSSSSQPLSQRLDEELLPTHPDHAGLQRRDPSHLWSIFIPLIIWCKKKIPNGRVWSRSMVEVQTHSLFVQETKWFWIFWILDLDWSGQVLDLDWSGLTSTCSWKSR